MRLLKFRAWNKKRQVMGSAMPFDVLLLDAAEDPSGPREELRHCELMQFTGLKDKNGKEIYEGDIVRCVVKGEVVFNGGEYALRKGDGSLVDQTDEGDTSIGYTMEVNREVIGNIYENPDLLK